MQVVNLLSVSVSSVKYSDTSIKLDSCSTFIEQEYFRFHLEGTSEFSVLTVNLSVHFGARIDEFTAVKPHWLSSELWDAIGTKVLALNLTSDLNVTSWEGWSDQSLYYVSNRCRLHEGPVSPEDAAPKLRISNWSDVSLVLVEPLMK